MKINEYEQQAKDFLERTGTVMEIRKVGVVHGFPFDPNDTKSHIKYRVTLTRPLTGDFYDFDFYDSHANYCEHKRPTKYDVLACLEKYAYPTDPWEFADEFGYTISSRADFERVQKMATACREQYDALIKLYGNDIFVLQNIQ